ncbi:TonB-dependent receptor [Novosphingobium sp. 2580]|uniref:TonB-dependent receptor n=2 Tax=Novosphingobium album (ex Hu et al. 2023) TaxID=2930093 RepID=A0ABT0B790_9SPHN|nr:TonB-dependent receptor [Novosphingobium album (ex Hu et al. 2023)]
MQHVGQTLGTEVEEQEARVASTADPALIGPYEPETLNAYEAGFKAELFDCELRTNGAAFENDFSNKQEEVIQPIPNLPFTGTAVENAVSARDRGAELEFTALRRAQSRLRSLCGAQWRSLAAA